MDITCPEYEAIEATSRKRRKSCWVYNSRSLSASSQAAPQAHLTVMHAA